MTNYEHIQISKDEFRKRINLDFLISEIKYTLPEKKESVIKDEHINFFSESLGIFEFNSEADWYINEVLYDEEEIILNILTNEEDKAKILIFLMEKVMSNFDYIETKSRFNAMEQLCLFHNEKKVYEDDTLEGLKAFSEKMNLISVCAYEDAEIGLWYYFEDEEDARILLVRYESYEVMNDLELSWKLNIENYSC